VKIPQSLYLSETYGIKGYTKTDCHFLRTHIGVIGTVNPAAFFHTSKE
jgi:hypothetical protein